jgi:FMN phosphatase YigB (HAD superfamily)
MVSNNRQKRGALLFDWGNTLMRVFPEYTGPMVTWPKLELMPFAGNILPVLHKEWIIALATNADDSTEQDIRNALEKVNISGRIDHIYCFRKIGYKKPSPEFFKYISEDLKIHKSDIIMIGDDLDSDVLGAQNAGIPAIWYNPFSTPGCDTDSIRTFQDYKELPLILSGMNEIKKP